jgi:transcriptional regulator with GAF, ATPase, and Fis domain
MSLHDCDRLTCIGKKIMSGLNLPPEVLALMKKENPEAANFFIETSECHKTLRKFITKSPDMLKMKVEVERLSPHEDPVLIQGPTGTGKELIAKALHGDRPKDRFIALNCAGLPETLVESELFGHEKGAFTGANAQKAGLMTRAEGGTLFLDEIGELPMSIQPKLLRAIQEKKIRKVGGEQEFTVNCRIVAATHRNLWDMTKARPAMFREDLYFRLSVFVLRTLPLEQRIGDIPLIIGELDKEERIKDLDEFCDKINPKKLQGNVRTLEAIVRRYYVLGTEPTGEE